MTKFYTIFAAGASALALTFASGTAEAANNPSCTGSCGTDPNTSQETAVITGDNTNQNENQNNNQATANGGTGIGHGGQGGAGGDAASVSESTANASTGASTSGAQVYDSSNFESLALAFDQGDATQAAQMNQQFVRLSPEDIQTFCAGQNVTSRAFNFSSILAGIGFTNGRAQIDGALDFRDEDGNPISGENNPLMACATDYVTNVYTPFLTAQINAENARIAAQGTANARTEAINGATAIATQTAMAGDCGASANAFESMMNFGSNGQNSNNPVQCSAQPVEAGYLLGAPEPLQ